MVLNTIHQFTLWLATGIDIDVVPSRCFVDIDAEQITLESFVGFVVSLWDIGEILLHFVVNPSELAKVCSALAPKTRRII